MIPIEELKKQHQEIGELLAVLSLLVPDDTARKTRIVERLFSELAKKVSDHIHLEEATLYKDLLVHKDDQIQRMARNFINGSQELKRLFTRYIRHDCTKMAKEENCSAFIKETEDIFGILQKRIEVEESRFYPLATK